MDSAPSSDPNYIRPRLRWRRVFRDGILIGMPVILGVSFLSFVVPGLFELIGSAYRIAFVAFWFFGVVGALYLALVPCPKCGRPFHTKRDGGYFNHFAAQCLNCGTRLDGSNV